MGVVWNAWQTTWAGVATQDDGQPAAELTAAEREEAAWTADDFTFGDD
jgi:hypothetical protein